MGVARSRDLRREFERLLLKDYWVFFRCAYSIANGSADDALDFLQDAALFAWKAYPEFRHQSEFKTWFYRIVCNASYNGIKKIGRERRGRAYLFCYDVNEEEELEGEFPDPRSDVPSIVERALRQERVEEVLRTMNPDYGIPLILHYYEGMSYQEIGEVLELTMEAVKSRLSRARKQMRDKVGSLYFN